MANPRLIRITSEVRNIQELEAGANSSEKIFLLDQSSLDNQGNATSNIILGRILPKSDIYNQTAFKIEINLPQNYPFVSPEIRFITPIYHPNVASDGKISLEILNTPMYGPRTSFIDILKSIVDLIDHPQLDHAINAEVAAEYASNRAQFDRTALEWVKKHGLPRE